MGFPMPDQNKPMWLLGTAICLIAATQSISAQMEFQSPNFPTQNFPAQTFATQTYQSPQEVLSQISRGSEQFALRLFMETANRTRGAGRNLILSPFSVWTLLLFTAEGANGNTYNQIRDVLGLPNSLEATRDSYRRIQSAFNVNTSTIELTVKQAFLISNLYPVEQEFRTIIEQIYGADVKSIDFRDANAREIINNYVTDATRGRITKIVKKADVDKAQMLLISAIYFKAQWRIPFNDTFTTVENFYDEYERVTGQTKMMFQRGAFPYTPIAELESHVLELPYGKENRLSMIIVLPRRNVTLSTVISNLPKFGMSRIFAQLAKAANEYEDDEVEVHLPRFSISSDLLLNGILEKMGIMDLFDGNANLQKIIKKEGLLLDKLIHKAQIEVTEEGTVATAVSGGVFANKATPPRIYANRPFAYFIVEKSTNIILFCGDVRNSTLFNV